MIPNKALTTSLILLFSLPAFPAFAYDDYYRHSAGHEQLHDRLSDRHERAHEEGFESRRDHRGYHQELRDSHEYSHEYRPAPRYNYYYSQPRYRIYREY